MAIELYGSMFGTNDGTTDLIEMSRDLYHKEMTCSFRSRNLASRVGHEIFDPHLTHPAALFVRLSTQIIHRY